MKMSLRLIFISLCCIQWENSALAEHQTSLHGIINLPNLQGAILHIESQTNHTKTHQYELVHAGDHFEDGNIDITDVDLIHETVKTREEGEEHTYTLDQPNHPKTALNWVHLQNAALTDVLSLYATLSDRVILFHPAANAASFSCEADWGNRVPNKTEITDSFAKWFTDRNTSVLEDGERFLQIIPTTMVQTASVRSKDLAVSADSNGMVDMENADSSQVLEIYLKLLGLRATNTYHANGVIRYFSVKRPLTKTQMVYAFETLLLWNDIKVISNNDGTCSVVKALEPKVH